MIKYSLYIFPNIYRLLFQVSLDWSEGGGNSLGKNEKLAKETAVYRSCSDVNEEHTTFSVRRSLENKQLSSKRASRVTLVTWSLISFL